MSSTSKTYQTLWFAYTSSEEPSGQGQISMYHSSEDKETLAQWIRRMRRTFEAQPAKTATYYGWALRNTEIFPLSSLTKTNVARLLDLMPNGVPRYVRCYDKGEQYEGLDRYTVVYSGRKGKGHFLYAHGTENGWMQYGKMHDSHARLDTNESGFSPAVGRRHPELGLHIPFDALPDTLKDIVRADYRAAWNLPKTVKESQLADSTEVRTEEGRREPLPEMPQPLSSGEGLARALASVAPKTDAEKEAKLDGLQAIAEKAKKVKGLSKVRFVVDDYLNVIGVFLGEPERLYPREVAQTLIREMLESEIEDVKVPIAESEDASTQIVMVWPSVALLLENDGLIFRHEGLSCLEGHEVVYHPYLTQTFTWGEFLVEVQAHGGPEAPEVVFVDPDEPEHCIRTGGKGQWTYCGIEGARPIPTVSVEEYEAGVDKPIHPDCEEAYEIMKLKRRPATEQDKRAALAQAEKQDLDVRPDTEGIWQNHKVDGATARALRYLVRYNNKIGEYYVEGQVNPDSPTLLCQWFFSEELAHDYAEYCRYCAEQGLFPLNRRDWQRYGFHKSKFWRGEGPQSPSPVAVEEVDAVGGAVNVFTSRSDERVRLARKSLEDDFTRIFWKELLPISSEWYWHDLGYALALWDTGITTSDGEAQIEYVLIGPHRLPDGKPDVIFQGQINVPDEGGIIVVGPQTALKVLRIIYTQSRDNEDGLAYSEREIEFYQDEMEEELMPETWPLTESDDEQNTTALDSQ